MALIVKDFQLLEAAHKDIPIYGKEKQALMDTSYVMVLNKHGVEIEEWETSYAYYSANPERFTKLMAKVEEAIHQSR